MLATAKNYDVICYQLRNGLYQRLENPLKKELDRLSEGIKKAVTSGKKIGPQPAQMLAQVFECRIKALKWLTADAAFDYLENVEEEVVPQVEGMKADKRMETLTDNLLFAIRCNLRVVEAIIGKDREAGAAILDYLEEFPDIGYKQFIASLALGAPNGEAARKMLDWVNSSLHIEFVLVAADIISRDGLDLPDGALDDLAFLAADSAQEYIALATELGILNARAPRSRTGQPVGDGFIQEQKLLAETGMDDFAANLLDT